MRCREFKQEVFLYASEELSTHSMKKFRKHIESCKKCAALYSDTKKNLKLLQNADEFVPSEYIKARIFEAAQRQVERKKKNLLKNLDLIFKAKNMRFALSYGSAALIVIFAVISIFKFKLLPNNRNIGLKWNDDFLRQVSNIESDMEKVESGDLDIALYDDMSFNSENHSSLFSDDFINLRKQVIELMMKN